MKKKIFSVAGITVITAVFIISCSKENNNDAGNNTDVTASTKDTPYGINTQRADTPYGRNAIIHQQNDIKIIPAAKQDTPYGR